MASTALADGGRAEWRVENNSLIVQKYDASGAPVGAQHGLQAQGVETQVVALSNGGFLAVGGWALRGYNYDIHVFDAASVELRTVGAPESGFGLAVAASPDGGFLVASMESARVDDSGAGTDFTWRPLLTLFDNSGSLLKGPVAITGDLPGITVEADGDYRLAWNDGGIARTLTIDPQNPPALAPPAAPSVSLYDDAGARTGAFEANTTDATPLARVAVSQTGTIVVSVSVGFDPLERAPDGGVAVTAADVARGYVEVPLTYPGGFATGAPYRLFARLKSDEGVVSEVTSKPLFVYREPDVWSVSDNAGTATGPVADGGTTDDATPTVRIGLESSGLAAGDDAVVRTSTTLVGRKTLTSEDVARGYVDITTSALADGTYDLRAASAPVAPYRITIQNGDGGMPEGQVIISQGPGSTLTGGAGNDTLHAGQGPDQLTGAGGADLFVYGALPWNAGHITDFAIGQDRLDLSQIFQRSGYGGSDPVADGRMTFQSDGAGGTRVFFDRDAPGSGDWPFLITTLDRISPAGLTWNQLGGPRQSELAITGSYSAFEGSSSVTNFTIGVDRSGATDQTTTVQWQVRLITADAADFAAGTAMSGTLTFAPGETSKLITFPVNGDTATEDHERFDVVISNVQGGVIRAGFETSSITIRNDDGVQAEPTLNIQRETVTQAEGNSGSTAYVFTVTRTGPTTDTLTATWVATGDATEGRTPAGDADFAGPRNGSLTFAPGETSKTITVLVAGDTTQEPDEHIAVSLRSNLPGHSSGHGIIVNDDGSPTGGQVINSPGPGSTLQGGPGDDTIIASQGADVLTGAGGADAFTFKSLPWSAGGITDFAVGTDRLDLSSIFQSSSYAGSDPIADGRMTLQSDGSGGTRVFFDRDAPNTGDWPFHITTLQGVSPAGLTWAQLSRGASNPPPSGGQVLTSDQYGDTLTGGAGSDTLNAGQGPDLLTGAGGADRFVFANAPWNAGRITDFTPGTDKIDLRGVFDRAGYSGSNPIADGYLFLQSVDGGLRLVVDMDGPNQQGDWPITVTTLSGVSSVSAGDFIFQ